VLIFKLDKRTDVMSFSQD